MNRTTAIELLARSKPVLAARFGVMELRGDGYCTVRINRPRRRPER
jgi:hypothetical protein